MAFIKQKQYQELKEAAKAGNPKAKAILEKLLAGDAQNDLDRMVGDYYNPATQPIDESKISMKPAVNAEAKPAVPTEQVTPNPNGGEMPQIEATPDVLAQLDKELDGVIDENDVPDMSFSDFVKKKRTDFIRSKKGPDYFKAFDPNGRSQYLADKEDKYGHKFDVKRKDIERSFRDYGGAIDSYSQAVNDLPEDNMDLNMDTASKAYDDLTENEDVMHGFVRSWDPEDKGSVVSAIKELCQKYGKKNVIAALNTIKGDNQSYHDFRGNQIDQEIGRYGKSLEKLLK